jgi:DNA-binding MarR family transcriptional regulator
MSTIVRHTSGVRQKPSLVQREIRPARPLQAAAEEAVVGLLRTAEVVRRPVTAVIAAHGITTQQYNVLRILRGAGKQGLPTLAISERMIEADPGITRLLGRLEAKQRVRRERSLQDRRQVLCWITPAGLELLARLDQPLKDADSAALGGLTGAEQKELIRLLDKVRASQP